MGNNSLSVVCGEILGFYDLMEIDCLSCDVFGFICNKGLQKKEIDVRGKHADSGRHFG